MSKEVRVIKKKDSVEIERSFDSESAGARPRTRELVEVVGDWIADWRKRSESETRRAMAECVRFRSGSSVEI